MMVNSTTGETVATGVVRCDTFWRRGRGLMFRRRRAVDHGQVYLFVEGCESVARAAIHMLFVFFPIAVLWLDAERRVVDRALARPFRPYYAPRKAAQYYVEGHPSLLERVRVGDRLEFVADEAKR
jgi:uncharacterized membrane protein (UPF0127 family)